MVIFFLATCPRSALLTWHAIVKGRDMLQLGLICKVGNGQTAEVYKTKQISEGKKSTQRRRGIADAQVFVQLVSSLTNDNLVHCKDIFALANNRLSLHHTPHLPKPTLLACFISLQQLQVSNQNILKMAYIFS
jgi:hypothetical protein